MKSQNTLQTLRLIGLFWLLATITAAQPRQSAQTDSLEALFNNPKITSDLRQHLVDKVYDQTHPGYYQRKRGKLKVNSNAKESHGTLLHFSHYLTASELAILESKGVRVSPGSWIPSSANRSGFMQAWLPISNIRDLAELKFVLRLSDGETIGNQVPKFKNLLTEEERLNPYKHPYIDAILLQLHAVARERSLNEAAQWATERGLKVREGKVKVKIISITDVPMPVEEVKALNGLIEKTWKGSHRAWVPINGLYTLANSLSGRYSVRQPLEPEKNPVASQAPTATGVDFYHTQRFNGAGVTIGLIDLGFLGLTAAVNNGDAPGSTSRTDMDLTNTGIEAGNENHGTNCLEVIFDMAPGSTYRIYKVEDDMDLAQAVTDGVAHGVNIFSHSLAWFNTGWHDNTGSVCEAANNASASGAIFVTSSGNDARAHWQGSFRDTNSNDFHEWTGTDEFNQTGTIASNANNSFRINLQWNTDGADTDNYDLFLYDQMGTQIASATNAGEAFESISHTNNTGTNQVYLFRLRRISGDGEFEIVVPNRSCQYFTSSNSTSSPSNVTGANILSVAAVTVGSFRSANPPIANYSGQGPTNDGAQVPHITGPTDVSTFTSGGAFGGTSCAAPNIAGAAAIRWDFESSPTATTVRSYLLNQALTKRDWGATGIDHIFGNGGLILSVPPVDVALVIDRSGSMTGAKITDAKKAAIDFVDFIQKDDKVAVVSFATTATTNFTLTTIASDATKTSAKNAINGIAAGGNTSIGAGMQFGQTELNKGDPNEPHVMLLLSDGLENTPPLIATVLPTIPQKTDIYTIGLGADVDAARLKQVADATGGTYHFTPTSAALGQIYTRIRGSITGQQTLAAYNGTISQGGTQTHNVTLDALTALATFLMTFQGSDVDLELVTPSGRLIDPQVAASDPNIEYSEGSTSDFYTVSAPEAGQWILRIRGVDVPTPESYFTTVQVSSQLKMEVALDKSEYNAGEPVLISANLKENAQAITGAAVSAEVAVPTTSMSVYQQAHASFKRDEDAEANNLGSAFESNNSLSSIEALQFITETVTLFDDGNHSDAAANDGVYANFFRNTAKDGSYTFTVRASGTASQAGAFMRETAFSTFVKPSTNPLILSLAPNSGQTGQTLNVTITGANFANGATLSFSGSGITVNATSFVSATQLTANISIAANTQPGPRDVIVRNPNGQSATSAGLFNVIGCGPAAATFADNFESGTDNWLALTPTNWGINLIGSDQVFCLSVPNAVRDEYVIQRGEPWLDFDLTLEAKSDAPSNKNFFIVFGTTDFRSATNNGYYLQFALGAVKLYRSTGGARGVEIASATRDYVSDNLFHRIRLERKQPNVKVTVDGLAVINVNDGAFAIGSIGFGSFNSQACFDDVQITGWRADPSYYSDGFYDGNADGWSPLTPSRWQVGSESGSLRYFINTTNYEPVNSARLGELSLLANKTLNDFVFECHAKSADAAARNENADLALVFGYQDFDSYYYVNFNSAPGLTQLFRTHNGVNTVLATFNQSTFTESDAAYHALRLERTGSQILAFFDGRQVLAATDNFFGAGQVGIGSYNDAGYFDNFALTGECSTPTTKIPVAFQVNLTVQICENKFAPATDQLSVRGSFNGFVDGVDVLTDPDGNGIYTTSVELDASMAGATIDYKYSFLHAGQTVVENLPNRQFIIPGGGGTVPLVFFDNDDQCNRNVPIFPTAASPQTAGSEFVVDVNIGDNTNPVSNLFGVSFELNYTNTALIDVVTPASANVTPGPFLGNDVIFVSNVDESAGKVSIGVSRKASQGGVNGNGVVAHIKFRSLASTPNGTTVTFDLRNVTANDPPGNTIALTAAATTITIASGIIVWPGDANNDKAVNQADVLPLGVYWTQTGPKRANASSAWIGQPATAWSPIAATYADANGDGVVNQADVLPIGVNFGRTHTALYPFAEKGDESTTLSKTNAATISTTFIGNTNPGQDFDLDVVVNDVTGLFGVSFELVYSPVTLLDPQATSAGSFMGTDPIFFANTDKATGKISAGVSRKAGQTSVTGAGVVAKIKMRVSSQAVRGQAITFTLQNVTANDANGQAMTLSVSPGPPLLVSVVSRRLAALPTVFALHQNSPNPFNPSTEISYDLPEASDVQVAVFDMLGKHVRTLVNERQVVGSYSIFWDGRDEYGQLVASGVFIAHLRAGKFVQSRKMLLVR